MSINIDGAGSAVWEKVKGVTDLYIGKTCEEADRGVRDIIMDALKPFRGAGYDYVLDDNNKVENIVVLEDDNLDNATLI